MRVPILTRLDRGARPGAMKMASSLFAAPMIAVLAGCVQVAAPDKPIEINLNINIKQEVLLRLQQDAKELIEQNKDVF
jgi:hypothetical protein